MFAELINTINEHVTDSELRAEMIDFARRWACDDDDCRIYIKRIKAGERSPTIGDEPFEYTHMTADEFMEDVVAKMLVKQ